MATGQMAESLTSQGLRFHRSGQLDRAASCYQTALVEDPDDADAACLLGVVRHEQGRPDLAVDLIRRAVHHRPDVPRFWASLGLALQALGRGREAAAAFASLLSICPDDAAAHVNRGVVMRGLGELEAALSHFEHAVGISPNLAEARTNLASLLTELGRAREALPHAQAAVSLQPDLVEGRIALGDAYRATGCPLDARAAYSHALRLDDRRARAAAGLGLVSIHLDLWDEGLSWLRRAVELEPRSVEYLRYLGEAAARRGLVDEVHTCCRTMLELDPNDAAAHNALGWVLHMEGRRDEAVLSYQASIRLRPDLAVARFNLGLLHAELGDLALAESLFRDALEREPTHATALARLASMLRGQLPDADLATLERRVAEPGLSPDDRIKLLFALGEVLDDRGEYRGAAVHVRRANALSLTQLEVQGQSYSPERHRLYVQSLIGAFSASLMDRLAASGSDTVRPVFIIGLPRSGTTLIEQILASHPQVFGAGEIDLARRSFEEIPELVGRPLPPERALPDLSAAHVAELARRYDSRLAALDGGQAARSINKMPENYFYLGLIAIMFPRATIIHCRRGLRDVALSCWNANFVEVRWAHHFDHIVGRMAEYLKLMEHWRSVLPAAPVIHDVSYEDAVGDLEGVARRLVGAMGLDWHPACLDFHRSRRAVITASQNQVRKPIYRSSIGRWRNYHAELAELYARVEDLERGVSLASGPGRPAGARGTRPQYSA